MGVILWPQRLARLAGTLALVLGILIWAGRPGLAPLHMACGAILVLCLWILAAVGLRHRLNPATAGIAFVWGLALPLLGVVQLTLPASGGYGFVRVLHLLLGVGAMAQAERLARYIRLDDETNRV